MSDVQTGHGGIVHVSTPSLSYDVRVGAGSIDGLGRMVESMGIARACVITETNVGPLYAGSVEESLAAAGIEVSERIVFPAGEASKNLQVLGTLLEGLAERGLTRDDAVIALGGGVTGDIAGLTAALYLRGIRVIQVPTSLLAMVDSSVGGKTAIDLASGKNLAGAFWQPSAVVADVQCLASVPRELFVDSCGEVVKHAALADPGLLEELISQPLSDSALDEERLARVVLRNVEIKRDVVNADEREGGLRQTLNLGHTIGHAIESASSFRLGHGSCVAAGLCMMTRAAARLGWCNEETSELVERCVAAHGLPVSSDVPTDVLMGFVSHDKKRHSDGVNIVVPESIGKVSLKRVSLDEMREIIELGR